MRNVCFSANPGKCEFFRPGCAPSLYDERTGVPNARLLWQLKNRSE
jgi:hypothetical protein